MKPGTPTELKSSSTETSLERLFKLYLAARQVENFLPHTAALTHRPDGRSNNAGYVHSTAVIRVG